MNKSKQQFVNCFLVLILIAFGSNAFGQSTDIQVKKIWDKAQHNAFTDLIRYENRFYCTFREGTGHVNADGEDNGKIRVIVSPDGENWESFALIEKQGFDLRDPNLSITTDGRLMLVLGCSKYAAGRLHSRATHSSFLNKSTRKFSDPVPVIYSKEVLSHSDNPLMNWLWRVVWNNGKAYGIIYEEHDVQGKKLVSNSLNLVSSSDGVHFDLVKSFSIEGKPDETALRFKNDGEMYIVVRMENQPPNQGGLLGRSKFPYKDWEMVNSGVKIGGPNLLLTNRGEMFVGTRTYAPGKEFNYDVKMRTALFGTDAKGKFLQLIEFPSGGDCSYPGMVLFDNNLYFSYYSSHEGGKANIYFSKIPMQQIRKINGKSASPFQ